MSRGVRHRAVRRALAVLLMLGHLVPTLAGAACTGSGNALSAATAADLAACITQAAGTTDTGPMTITLTAGATYTGNFVFPDTGSRTHHISVQSSALAALSPNVRVNPTRAPLMAKIQTDTSTQAIQFNIDSHHWKFQGLEITGTATQGLAGQAVPLLIANNGDGSITYGHWPHDIIFDRNWIHPYETDPLPWRAAEEGIAIDGKDIEITNNYINDFMGCQSPTTASTVVSISNANPAVVTLSETIYGSDPGHKYLLLFAGATGGWTPVNGAKIATWLTPTTWSIQDYDTSLALTNVNTIGSGSYAGQTVVRQNCVVTTTRAIFIGAGPGPYLIQNNYLEAYYGAIFTGGGGLWVEPANQATVGAAPAPTLTSVHLDKIGNLKVGDLIGISTLQDQTISAAATSGSDCTGAGAYTCLTVDTHGYPAGTRIAAPPSFGGGINITGFTGVNWSTINTLQAATVVDATHLVIPVDSSTWGPATFSSPLWTAQTTAGVVTPSQWCTGHVTGISGTDVTYEWWGHQPENTGGNGCGIKAAVGATVQFNGLNVDGIKLIRNTIGPKQWWMRLLRDYADTCNSCGPTPKAHWEAKTGTNITITGNIFGNLGPGLVNGGSMTPNNDWVSIAINKANQTGSTPWISTANWTIRSNVFQPGTAFKIVSMGEEYLSGTLDSGLVYDNNLLMYSQISIFTLDQGDSITITHNTCRGDHSPVGTGTFVYAANPAATLVTNTLIRNNVCSGITSAYSDAGSSPPWAPIRDHNWLTDDDCDRTVCAGFSVPAGDHYVAGYIPMKFVDIAACDSGANYHGCRLASDSPGHLAASDGTDAGVNFTDLENALGSLASRGGSW